MAIFSKGCKQYFDFGSRISLCLALQTFEAFFVDYESFLELNSPDILVLYERNLDDSGNFTVRGCFPLI